MSKQDHINVDAISYATSTFVRRYVYVLCLFGYAVAGGDYVMAICSFFYLFLLQALCVCV